MKKISILFLFLVLSTFFVLSQNEVLLTIENQPVLKSEFERIYHKNSNIEGYENKQPADYLDMFINFKLKVLEAKRLGFDTVPGFINELAGYREQLSRPYLQDRKLMDQLLQQAYYRTLNEVSASHIMVKLPDNATPSDTLAAFNKAVSIRNRIIAGESFDKIARQESDDPSGRANGGNLGWFSAFTMVYPFENAAYNTHIGEYSYPVKSRYGFHIIRVNALRPALGEIKLAHIMVKADENVDSETITKKKEKINACYNALQGGSPFADLVKQYSEDAGTVRSHGQMRWLRSGELPEEIEEIVFNLSDSGEYTPPLQSQYGWHIFQLLGKKPIASLDQLKPQLEERILMDERGKRAEEGFLSALKKEYGFAVYSENISMITDLLDSAVYSGNWNPSAIEELIEPVFTIDSREYTLKDLVNFINKSKRYNKSESFSDIVNRKTDELVLREMLNYEKQQLDKKYPSFKYLMEEYHDGILLFNIMDNMVWSKAVSDTTALKSFYEQHRGNYQWKERADISVYTINDPALMKPAVKLARKSIKTGSSSAELISRLCGDSIQCIEVDDRRIEKDEPDPLGEITWKKGFVKTLNENGKVKILAVNEILPPAPKAFAETQGQVTADYQNFLDKQWTDSLRAKYSVVVDRSVLDLIK